MRLFEIITAAANLAGLAGHLFPRLRAAALAAACAALAQVLIEGPRWQMAPAYALALALAAAALTGIVSPRAKGISIGAGVVVLAVSVLLPSTLPVFRFPAPSGPYAVGTVTYYWADPGREDYFSSGAREIAAQVWYPAAPGARGPRAPYIQDADDYAHAMAKITRFPSFLFTQFRYVRTNAIAAAPMADDVPRRPVLIYLTGLGGFRSASTFQIEDLASRGYVVVGLDQPGGAAVVRFPDGRTVQGLSKSQMDPLIDQSIDPQPDPPSLNGRPLPEGIIPYLARDASMAMDRLSEIDRADPHGILTGRMDLARVGIFGISLGAIVAAQACHDDPRLKAALLMDANLPADVVRAGLTQPVMLMTRDEQTMRLERQRSGGWTERDIALTIGTMRAVYEKLPGAGYFISIPGIFHINFTDAPYWLPVSRLAGLTGPVDSGRMFSMINAYTAAFFDAHLRGMREPLLDGPSGSWPEVRFERR